MKMCSLCGNPILPGMEYLKFILKDIGEKYICFKCMKQNIDKVILAKYEIEPIEKTDVPTSMSFSIKEPGVS